MQYECQKQAGKTRQSTIKMHVKTRQTFICRVRIGCFRPSGGGLSLHFLHRLSGLRGTEIDFLAHIAGFIHESSL